MPQQRPRPTGSGISARICPSGSIRWLRLAFHPMSVELEYRIRPVPDESPPNPRCGRSITRWDRERITAPTRSYLLARKMRGMFFPSEASPGALQALEQAGQSPMDLLQGGSVPSSPRRDRPIGITTLGK